MNSLQLLEISHYVIIGICWLISMTLYFRRNIPRYLLLFPPYLFVTFTVSLAAYWMAIRWGNNHILYNIYTIFSFGFMFYVLLVLLKRSRLKTILLYLDCIFLAFSIGYVCLVDISVFSSLRFVAGSMLIIFHCLLYLEQLFKSPLSLYKEPSFWVCCSLLCLYGGMMTLVHANQLLYIFPQSMLKTFFVMVYLTNDISYSLLIIAFLWTSSASQSKLSK